MIRALVITAALFLLAGGGGDFEPQQQIAKKSIGIVIQEDRDYTKEIAIAFIGLAGTLGAAFLISKSRRG